MGRRVASREGTSQSLSVTCFIEIPWTLCRLECDSGGPNKPQREVKSAELRCVAFGRYRATGEDIPGRFLLVPLAVGPVTERGASFGQEEDQL